jgi:tryptophanyl-tRNA synthetase
MKRLLSGIQPTGILHLGNYLGAVKNWVELINKGDEAFIFIPDLHSITVPQDPKKLKENVLLTAATYIACGIDPKKSKIFVQSSIAEHTELAWILSCFTATGWMNRMTQFKEKSAKYKDKSSLGLYMYPVLMAADILLYQPDYIPVGEDQKQHVELTRDIAESFNRTMQVDFFKIPEPLIIGESARIKSLRDGTKKMSKSDESDYSRINLDDDPDIIRQKFKKSKSDSIESIYYDKKNRPEISNLLSIYSAFSGKKIKDIEIEYQKKRLSDFKSDLAEITINALSPISQEIRKLIKDKDYVTKVLKQGAEQAREVAAVNLQNIKKIVGLF